MAALADSDPTHRFGDNLPTLCWVADPDGAIRWYNKAWHEFCGTTAAEMEGWGWTSVHDPDVLPSVLAQWRASIEGGHPFEMVFPLRRADGVFRSFLTRIRPERSPAGDILHWYGVNIDVQDQVDAEAKLRELAIGLEAQVAERAASLLEAEEALRQSQKMEAIGQLTGGVAHDFNNLLTVIRGSVELLQRPDLPEPRRARYIQAIAETADRASTLTSQLLAFARRQTLTPEVFDVGESLRSVGGMVKTLAGSKVVVTLDLSPEPLYVLADRSQFDTSIVNMAINARDAMNGEGRLSISVTSAGRIPAVRAHPIVVGNYVAIALNDSGSGIAPDALERIFEPFFTTKAIGVGTGLGLSQAIGFAKQSSGEIHVVSTPGEGTTFTLYLPRVEQDDGARDEAVLSEDNVGGAGVCVLVVEDNMHVGEFAQQALAELGYDSVLATDGLGALAELEKNCSRFHVVFSDVVMPTMSGIELAEKVKAEYPHVPVILTSGYSHVLAERGIGDFELLHKPYSIEQLSRVLRRAVGSQPAG